MTVPLEFQRNHPEFKAGLSASILIGVIRVYQKVLSPVLPARCRFYPSCSHYTEEAVSRFGAFRGILLGSYRILRCHPLSRGGHDPVPETFSKEILFVNKRK